MKFLDMDYAYSPLGSPSHNHKRKRRYLSPKTIAYVLGASLLINLILGIHFVIKYLEYKNHRVTLDVLDDL